ncbi:hypothetical protein SCLARK_001503 [Spiroplasma clarkii]|uniref:hypothetical protein n=1 Tax=Spiroplasma clarkii TaxID=2139 RepID=UPI000B54D4CE|nr:hypothetical protein [Spiroplasma clarkii]ARU92016.1 hypothetical protein SCLARK_001503 [Spiroplasma clarkii]
MAAYSKGVGSFNVLGLIYQFGKSSTDLQTFYHCSVLGDIIENFINKCLTNAEAIENLTKDAKSLKVAYFDFDHRRPSEKNIATEYDFDAFIDLVTSFYEGEEKNIFSTIKKIYDEYLLVARATVDDSQGLYRDFTINWIQDFEPFLNVRFNTSGSEYADQFNEKLKTLYIKAPGVAIVNNILINLFRWQFYLGEPDEVTSYINNEKKLATMNKFNILNHFALLYQNNLNQNKLTTNEGINTVPSFGPTKIWFLVILM